MLFLLRKDRGTEHNTHFCMPLEPVFTRRCGGGVHFMDEPTIGLDIGTKEAMRQLVQKINRERGVTIILTSHDLKDVEDICRRIIVIDNGRVVCDKGIGQLAKEYSMDRGLRITFSAAPEELLEKLRDIPGISYLGMDDRYTLEMDFDPGRHTAFELVQQVDRFAKIQDFRLMEPDIERVIEKIYRSGEGGKRC